AADGARGLLLGVGSQEAQGRLCLRQRPLRQRRHAHVGDRAERRHLRVRRLSGHRCALPAAGRGDRPQEARGRAVQDPADPARARAVRADLRVLLAERNRSARRGARADADQSLSVVGATRGGKTEEAVGGSALSSDRRAARGRWMLNVAPCWARGSREIRPPWRWTSTRAIASPRAMPGTSVERALPRYKGGKRRSASSGEPPAPASETVMTASSSASVMPTRTWPPGGENFTALS